MANHLGPLLGHRYCWRTSTKFLCTVDDRVADDTDAYMLRNYGHGHYFIGAGTGAGRISVFGI